MQETGKPSFCVKAPHLDQLIMSREGRFGLSMCDVFRGRILGVGELIHHKNLIAFSLGKVHSSISPLSVGRARVTPLEVAVDGLRE